MNQCSSRVRSVHSKAGWLRGAVVFFATLMVLVSFERVGGAVPATSDSAAPVASAAPEDTAPSPWQAGPTHVDLGHDVAVDLTADYAFLPKEPAGKLLEANGNLHNENLLGIIAGTDRSSGWFAVLSYEAEGFVKDDEQVDAAELLSALKEGTEEANEERKTRGFLPLNIDGWSEPPRYDKSQHHLVWALLVSDAEGKSVNYNTRILGRHGYVSLNLVTDPEKLALHKPHASTLLGGTKFSKGARYEDFDSKTDKVAEYGLAGLVMAGAGLGAAKLVKLGLLAKFWKVIIAALIAGKKLVVLAVLAIVAFVKKLLAGRKNEPAAP